MFKAKKHLTNQWRDRLQQHPGLIATNTLQGMRLAAISSRHPTCSMKKALGKIRE